MQRLIVLFALTLLWTGMSGAFVSVAAAQDAPKPPEGAVWYDPANPEGPKIQPNEYRDWRRKNQSAFRSAYTATNPTKAQKDELAFGAAVYAHRMTDPKERNDIPNVINEVLTRMAQSSKGGGRTALLEALTKELSLLLRQEDVVVRTNAAIFLGRLDTKSAPLAGGGSAVRYWPPYRPLIGAIEDPNQDDPVKAVAAEALRQILELSDIPRRERDDAVIRLSNHLRTVADPANWPKNPVQRNGHWLYIRALIRAIAAGDEPRTLTNAPLPVEVLTELVVDGRQDWRVRTLALHSISEFPLEDDNAFDIALFAKLSAWLMNEAVRDFQAQPKKSYWRPTMLEIYLSFRPLTPALAKEGLGWEAKSQMAKFRGAADTTAAAFDVVKAVIIPIASAQPNNLPRLDNKIVDALKAYVEANMPAGAVHVRAQPLKFANARPNATANANPETESSSGEDPDSPE